LFERAAARGDASAQYSMGTFADEGRGGLSADPREAFRWWKRSAEQGQSFAQARLGMAYAQGKGTRSNLVEAYAWLSASDVEDAKPILEELDKRIPAPLLAKARRLADERRALREATNPPQG
ncbi:MAG: tetratricopeptide repeat protein, partial [Myxococcota bacterium]